MGDLYMAFIHPEKAYDRVPRKIIWRPLEKNQVSYKYIEESRHIQWSTPINVGLVGGDTIAFSITNIGLFQGSTLRLYQFVLVMDELFKHVQDEVHV